MKDFEEKLKKAGLTGAESKVYLGLLKYGSLNGSALAKRIEMDRTLTYQVLNNLIKKGLVNYIIKEHKRTFEASHPSHLLNPIKEQEAFVQDLIPELGSLTQEKDLQQEIAVYEGRGGLRALMREIIQYKSFSSFGATGRAYDFLYEMPRITREVTRKGNWARIIFHPKYSQHKLAGVKGIDCRYLSLEGETTTTIFGDCVSIHIVREKPFVVLIKNKEIARNYQSVFETLWEIAKQKPL